MTADLTGHQLTLMKRADGYKNIGAPAKGSCSCGKWSAGGKVGEVRDKFYSKHLIAVVPKRGVLA